MGRRDVTGTVKEKAVEGETACTFRFRSVMFIAARVFLGAIFLYASLHKIADPHAFAEAIWRYQILPGNLIAVAALILPWVELLAGTLLIFGWWTMGSIAVIDGLLFVFFAVLLFNIFRGLDINCGCFTSTDDVAAHGRMWWYVIRDSALLLLGLWIFGRTLKDAERKHSATEAS